MRVKNSRTTIKEVASAAGVSQQTVSRVINNRPDVSPETRKRIQDIIEVLGYSPSALARSLIRQRSYTLGVVTAGLGLIGPSRTLSGITTAAEAAGYALLLKELPYFDANHIAPIFQALISRHVDGVIWAVPEVGENRNWVNKLSQDVDVPVVFLTMEPRKDISAVSINNYLGGRIATEHLLQQGYKHIGHISGPLDWWEARQRLNGWKDALSDAGIDALDSHWAEGNWSSSSGGRAFEALHAKFPEMDALFVANDQMSLGAIQCCSQNNIRIADDLGIIGFDNISEAPYFLPPLSTIQQDLYSLGKVAVEEIIHIIEASYKDEDILGSRSIMMSPTLIVRQSSLKKRE